MKKIIALLLALILTCSLVACGDSASSNGGTAGGATGTGATNSAEGVGSAEMAFVPVRSCIAAGATACAAILEDGTVECSLDKSEDQYIDTHGEWKEWKDIVDISMPEELLVGLKSDGTVVWCGGRVKEYDYLTDDKYVGAVDTWKNVVQVAAGPYNIAALKEDGTVEVAGGIWTKNLDENKDFVQMDIYTALFCVRKDGTVYCYNNSYYEGQTWTYDVSSWTDIAEVSAGFDHAAGLKKDGTVVATGNNEKGQCDVSKWTDIVQVEAGREYTIGLKSDGTVVYCGDMSLIPTDVLSTWTNIVEVSGFFNQIMGLKSDGTFVYTGMERDYNPVSSQNISGK